MIHKFSFPTPIHFGPGSRLEVAPHLKGLGYKKPLIVTDRGIAPLPIFAAFQRELSTKGLTPSVFTEIWGNPVESQVSAGVRAYREQGADSIIGFGGGAALDVAKAIALMVTHPGDLFDYEDEKPGARPIDQEIPYWVALPTTAGTGSEVGRSSVVSDETTHVKKIIFSPKLLARAVFADPELTLELPPKITAATGMDALTHCMEAYLAKAYHPLCDGIALEGIRLIGQSLKQAVAEPRNLEARGAMLMASMMGAIAFQKGLGVTHSCAHALGTVADLHHGLANGVMVNYALRHNAEVAAERFKIMAETLRLPNPSAASLISWLEALKAETGIPRGLKDCGVHSDKLGEPCRVALEDSCHQNNPRPCSHDDFKRIFTAAFA